MPAFCAAVTTSTTLSGPPMLPGLIRTAATPASIAFSARLALKWMSAMIGTGEKRISLGNASASSSFGTATRTISQPAATSEAICAVVAGTSCVFVSVIDWTTTGAPPPILTPPTLTERSLGTRASLTSEQFLAAAEVVPQAEVQQEEEDRQPDGAVAKVCQLRER